MQNQVPNKSSCIKISSTVFNNIYDICKSMKSNFFKVILYDGEINTIFGTSDIFSYLVFYTNPNIYIYDNSLVSSFITSKAAIAELSLLMATPSEFIYIYEDYITNDALNDRLAINRNVIGYRGREEFDRVIGTFMYLTLTDNRIEFGNINEDNAILQMSQSKVSDNVIPYIKDMYYMTIYKGIVPLNKADKLSLTIYNFPDGSNRFVADFILKKKKLEYHFLYAYINLI